jgi:hypothetical protein
MDPGIALPQLAAAHAVNSTATLTCTCTVN